MTLVTVYKSSVLGPVMAGRLEVASLWSSGARLAGLVLA